MYPYAPPQVAALANRFNPQPMNTMQDQSAPLVRQGPPATSGQIQPSGLQPQPAPAYGGLMDRFNLRPQVAALAQQYNPQFNPMPNVFGSIMSNPNVNPAQAQNAMQQFQLAQQMQNNVGFAQPYSWNNPQPAYNPGFTQAGQAQNNFLTTPTQAPMPNMLADPNAFRAWAAQNQSQSPQPAPVTVPNGGFAPATLNAPMSQMTPGGPQPNRAFVPGALGARQRLGGGINGLARYYTR